MSGSGRCAAPPGSGSDVPDPLSIASFVKMSPGVAETRCGGTHLLLMVAEFTLLVLLFDLAAVVHPGSFGVSARTLSVFFFFFSARLALLLRCLLLLLQDSSFCPLISHKDHRQTDKQSAAVQPSPAQRLWLTSIKRLV